MSGAYYNEIDPKAAAWLRELIRVGCIAPGDVDERSIVDVRPADLRGYRQCHFFAGIGVWSYALRQAGWSDDEEVWTGSCPCQPFSQAGKGLGHEDERHLWPAFFRLINESRPVVVFGEQVADGDGYAWLDDVGDDLESLAYAVGAVCPASCGFGSPDERQRMYWVADANSERLKGLGLQLFQWGPHATVPEATGRGEAMRVAHADDPRSQRRRGVRERAAERAARSRGVACGLAYADGGLEGDGDLQRSREHGLVSKNGRSGEEHRRTGPVDGFWGTADWLRCRDEWWRPVEPGTFPLVDGAPARLVRIRGYGNAVNAEVAIAFIEAYLDVRETA